MRKVLYASTSRGRAHKPRSSVRSMTMLGSLSMLMGHLREPRLGLGGAGLSVRRKQHFSVAAGEGCVCESDGETTHS